MAYGSNDQALAYLDEAMFASSQISDEERANGQTDWDKVYPRTKAETEYMDDMLQRASQVAGNPGDPDYAERYNRLSEIVEYSKKRHSTWKWSLIVGALISAAVFYYFKGQSEKDAAQRKIELEQVTQWEESKVSSTTWDKCPDKHADNAWSLRLASADKFKMYKLINLKMWTESRLKSAKSYKESADTSRVQETKDKFLSKMEQQQNQAAKYRAEFDSINAMDFAGIHEVAIADMTERLQAEESHGNTMRNYMIYLLVLIPLYIITGYPHGYTITRHQRRSGCLNIFRKVGFGIAAFCFGAGLAMSLLPDYVVEKTFSDGHKETSTEFNIGNAIILFLKFGLMVIGAVLFCLVATIVMTLETLFGLVENFAWKAWYRKLFPAKQEAAI